MRGGESGNTPCKCEVHLLFLSPGCPRLRNWKNKIYGRKEGGTIPTGGFARLGSQPLSSTGLVEAFDVYLRLIMSTSQIFTDSQIASEVAHR